MMPCCFHGYRLHAKIKQCFICCRCRQTFDRLGEIDAHCYLEYLELFGKEKLPPRAEGRVPLRAGRQEAPADSHSQAAQRQATPRAAPAHLSGTILRLQRLLLHWRKVLLFQGNFMSNHWHKESKQTLRKMSKTVLTVHSSFKGKLFLYLYLIFIKICKCYFNRGFDFWKTAHTV